MSSAQMCFADFGGRKHTSAQAAMATEEHLCPRTCKHPSDHVHGIMVLYRHDSVIASAITQVHHLAPAVDANADRIFQTSYQFLIQQDIRWLWAHGSSADL